jgi:hypothetical protein
MMRGAETVRIVTETIGADGASLRLGSQSTSGEVSWA